MPTVSRLTSLLSRVFPPSLIEIAEQAVTACDRRFPSRRSRRSLSRIQSLEDRALLAVFTVTTTADSGPGSLRDAITQANVGIAADTIEFNIPGPGPHTIQPLTPLPAFASPIFVNGTSQPGYSGSPAIELNGSSAGPASEGLWITANGSDSGVAGLAINRFGRNGIFVDSADRVWIRSNFLGTTVNGSQSAGNAWNGVLVQGTSDDVVLGSNGDGTNDANETNVISGNGQQGVYILGTGSGGNDNRVAGNRIGTNAAGSESLPNGEYGLIVSGRTFRTIVGGSAAHERNLVSGNAIGGIAVIGLSPSQGIPEDTLVQNNFVGTDIIGSVAIPNQGNGIYAEHSTIRTIIGTDGDGLNDALEGNLVSGNQHNGVDLSGAGNVAAGNIIGLNVTGEHSLPNRRQGILVSVSNGSSGPLIGTNADGLSDAFERNVISTNIEGQIFLSNGAAGVTIAGNYVGTNAAGTRGFLNQASGIQGSFQQNLRIGGGRAGEGNLISGNSVGVEVNSANSSVPVVVAGNRIGTDATGLNAIPNSIGVRVSEWVIIGTDGDGLLDASEGNVISGNSGQGVLASNGSRVAGNLIGLGADGIKPLGNGSEGIFVDNATLSLQTIIGTNSDGFSDDHEGNVIGYNQFGIITERGDTSIRGNYIGTTPEGFAIPNAYDGIRTRDRIGERVDIGGPGLFDRNVIRFNSRYGISNFSNSGGTFLNAFGQSNIIAQNIAGAIGFSTENSESRGDRNFPVFTSLAINGGLLTAEGFARAGQVIELYESGPTTNGFGEGRSLLATFVEGSAGDQDASTGTYGPIVNGVHVGTDTTNRFRFVVPVPAGLNEGMLLASLGAAPNGAMSVFSPSFRFGELTS